MEEKQTEVIETTATTEQKNKGGLSKGKKALIIIVAILYTAVVSLVSSIITKTVIEYKENKATEEKAGEKEETTTGSNKVEVVMGDGEKVSADKELTTLPGGSKKLTFNQPITVGDVMEITFTSWEWADEIYPSYTSGYYHYYADDEGEKYVVLKGTIKNISSKEFSTGNVIDVDVRVNNKYEISDAGSAAEALDGSGLDSYQNIKSLQTLNFVIVASFSDEVYNEYENVKFELELLNDSDKIGEYYYGNEKKPIEKYTIVVERPL